MQREAKRQTLTIMSQPNLNPQEQSEAKRFPEENIIPAIQALIAERNQLRRELEAAKEELRKMHAHLSMHTKLNYR